MSLKHYLELAFKESRLTSSADLDKIQHLDGILQPNQENLILVYGGSFNPPHQGHIDVILSGLNPILAAVSILILPSEDFHLRNKLAKSHSEFFLNMKRRADILDAIPSIPKQKVWIWPSTWYPFKTCIDALVRLTAADGFEVAFSHLIGPDNVIPNDPLDIFPYRLPRILVSNKARHIAAHFRSDGRPERWNGFEEWIRSEEGHVDERGEAVVLWKCLGTDDSIPGKSCWYLQYLNPASTDINSTSLRQALVRDNPLDEISLNQMSTGALMQLVAPLFQ